MQQDEEQHAQPGELAGALSDQRVSRKRAQEDVKLLANRIALLKQEEQKAWKKIEETKKKANDIINVRQRNADTNNYKMNLAKQREQDEHEQMMKNQQYRLSQKEAIRIQQMTNAEKNYREAERLKHESRQHAAMIDQQKQIEKNKNDNMKNMVHQHKMEAME